MKILDLMEGRLFYTLHGHQVGFWFISGVIFFANGNSDTSTHEDIILPCF